MLEDLFNNERTALFRFNFFANQDEDGGDGISLDNFRIIDPVPQNAEAVKILKPFTGCEIGDTNRSIRAMIKNVGDDPMTNIPITVTVTRTSGVNLQVNNPQVLSTTLNTTVQPRDFYKFSTDSIFDFSQIGDYDIEIVLNLPNDPKFANDTMRKTVEHFEGCDLSLMFNTADQVYDSSRWRIEAKLDGRTYIYTETYDVWDPMMMYGESVCIKNGAKVKFQLGDYGDGGGIDSSISDFSVIGYDTSYIENRAGGPNAPDANFTWICPPQLSATPFKFRFNNGDVQFPLSKNYNMEVFVRNNGLDSLRKVLLELFIDNQLVADSLLTFEAPSYVDGLRFRRTKRIDFGAFYLSPGGHNIYGHNL